MKKLIVILSIILLSINSYSQEKTNKDTVIVTKHIISRRLLSTVDMYNIKHVVNDITISETVCVSYGHPRWYFWKKEKEFKKL